MDESTPPPEETNNTNQAPDNQASGNDAPAPQSNPTPHPAPEMPAQAPQTTPGYDHPHFVPEQPTKASGFLLVVCILTFIGSGLGVLFTGYTAIQGADGQIQAARQLESTMHMIDSSMKGYILDSIEMAYVTADNFTIYMLVTFMLTLGCLFGGILMFRLNKQGFYLYTAATFFQIIFPLLFLVNSTTITSAVFIGFFGLLFVILYAVNLKHMR